MAAQHVPLVDEEALLSDELTEYPRPVGFRRAALLAGGLAATALVGVGAAAWSSGDAAVPAVAPAPAMGVIDLAEIGNHAPSERSFALHSIPFVGGRDFNVSGSREQGMIKIDEDGVVGTYYLPGATTIDDHTTVEFRPPYRFYLMKEPTVDYSDEAKFKKLELIGKTFSVDMNMNGASCGCNLNFYMVDMPWGSKGKEGDYYCDAQCFDGLGCCSEWDMNEGNAQVQQITNHACTKDYTGHPDWTCHKWGEPLAKTHVSHFGPGQTAGIDSKKTFNFAQSYDIVDDHLTVTTTISQGDAKQVYKMGPNSQLDAMWKGDESKGGSLKDGMVFVTGYWYASSMNWLDSEGCGNGPEHCNINPAYISNWKITRNKAKADSPVAVEVPPASPVVSPAPALGHAPSERSFALHSMPFVGGRDFNVSGSREQGMIKINEDGVVGTYFLPGATTIDDHTTVEFRPPYRFYLMKEPTVDYSDEAKFKKLELIGKTFSVDMNMNGASCGCNLNFYMVDMPWGSKGSDGDYYCDGQCFDGLGCCSEWDMNEGNAQVQQITNHACTKDYNGHPDWVCHKWGEPLAKTHVDHFGPGQTAGIDSKKTFNFAQRYDIVDDHLVVTTTISQGDAKQVYNMGPNSQLDAMWKGDESKGGSLKDGMVFVTGYWYDSSMNWLDSEGCGDGPEHCNINPAYISNWKITTNKDEPSDSQDNGGSNEGAGKCCWSGCGGCKGDGSWCHHSMDNCHKCGQTAEWCRGA